MLFIRYQHYTTLVSPFSFMDQIAEVKAKTPIVDFITQYVPLKKAGRNFKGLCPFHSEKSPSFIVSPERDMWYCFGCQKGGDTISFLMEIEHMTFPEALAFLAEKAGIVLTTHPFETDESKRKKRHLEMNHLAGEYFHYVLTKHQLGEKARQYLKERGVKHQTITTFQLGYAPDGWENLARFLRKKGYSDKELIEAGLVISGSRGVYDRFRNRIIFPLIDHHDATLGFAGRVLSASTKEAKYINSPETPLYTKGNTVYGIHATRAAIRKEDKVVVVEGEFDVISSFQAGVGNVVAIKGTALTEAQIMLLKRFTNNLVIALDHDSAGDAAMRRGIASADHANCTIHVVTIPSGKDPDEAARSDPSAWKKAVETAVPFYDFLITSVCSRFDPQTAYGKKQITDELFPLFSGIKNSIIQAHYVKQLAQKLSLSEEKIMQGISMVKTTKTTRVSETEPVSPQKETREEYLAALIMQSIDVPQTCAYVTSRLSISDFHNSALRKLMGSLDAFLKENAEFSSARFAAAIPSELTPLFDRLFLRDLGEVISNEDSFIKELEKAILYVRRDQVRMKLRDISTKIHTEAEGSLTIEKLNQEFTDLSRTLKQLGAT